MADIINLDYKLNFTNYSWSFSIAAQDIDYVKKHLSSKDNKKELDKNLIALLSKNPENKDEEKIQDELIKTLFDLGAKIDLSVGGKLYVTHNVFSRNMYILEKYIQHEAKDSRVKEILNSIYVSDSIMTENSLQILKFCLDNIVNLSSGGLAISLKNIADNYQAMLDYGFTVNNIYQLLILRCVVSENITEVKLQNDLMIKIIKDGFNITDAKLADIKDFQLNTIDSMIQKGLDARSLLFFDNLNDASILPYLDLLEKYHLKILAWNVLNQYLYENNFVNNASIVKRLFVDNMQYKLDDQINVEDIFIEVTKYGPQFADILHEEEFQFLKYAISNNGSMIHILAKLGQFNILNLLLNENKYNVNVVNELGQNALFYAKSTKIIELLISYNINVNQLDNAGNKWFQINNSRENIYYAMENNYISEQEAQEIIKQYLVDGNFINAAAVAKLSSADNINVKDLLVSAIIQGIESSVEGNKYKALLHLVNEAGIEIPNKHKFLLRSIKDNQDVTEFKFLYGMLHKLAQHYINLSKSNLIKNLSNEGFDAISISKAIDDAFVTQDFSLLKKLCNNESLVLSKIIDKFSALAFILSESTSLLNNDFAFEVITLNGLSSNLIKLDNTQPVFRGVTINLTEEDIDSNFKYGHQAFTSALLKKQIFLNFYSDNEFLTEEGQDREFGGTYSSLEAFHASKFANGMTSFKGENDDGILYEFRFDKDMPQTCSSKIIETEIITSNIAGENIIAIYKVNTTSVINGPDLIEIISAIKNPYIKSTILPSYKVGDNISSDSTILEQYKKICDQNIYSNKLDFTDENFIQDQASLSKDHFSNREGYKQDCFSLTGYIVDLELQCPVC
jgi:hypothetical protein